MTVCVQHRKNILWDKHYLKNVGNDAPVVPSPIGQIVVDCWDNIEKLNENVICHKFVLMPNHIHGIIIIKNTESVETVEKKYGFEIAERRGRRSLQGIIKDFKSVTTRRYKKIYDIDESLWQKSFHDHVIRNQDDYQKIWTYIDNNHLKWELDCFYTN